MGSKLEDIEFKKRNFQPGPGAYEIKSLEQPPTMKFGTGSRISLDGGKEQKMKPGPGAYSAVIGAVATASPKFGFGTGTRTEESNFKANKIVPGPGTYMSKTFVGKEGSRISMGAVLNLDMSEKEKKAKPGPGAYDPNWSSTKNKAQLTRFGSEVRRDLAFEKQREFQ